MKRLILFLGLAVLGMAPLADAVPARAAGGDIPLSLSRDRAVVADHAVRLGDLFTNAGPKADTVVGKAPDAGERAIYDVHRLAGIARAHGLYWQARSWDERVVIERESQTIDEAAIVTALRTALDREGLTGTWELDIAGRTPTITLAADLPATVAAENMRFDSRTGRFSTILAAPAGDPDARRVTVTGQAHHLIEVPTVARRMANGDVIRKDDLHWVAMRAGRVGRNVVTESDRLIGMTPRRTLVAGKAIRATDIRAPRAVLKGSIVTMMLTTAHMVLTSKGRAMEDGALGDTIRIINLQSKAVIEARITAPNTAEVAMAGAYAPVREARR